MSQNSQIQHTYLDVLDSNNNNDLDIKYQVIRLKLHECASHEPGEDLQKDFEIEQLEHKLMATQEDILERLPISKSKEMKTLELLIIYGVRKLISCLKKN